MLKSQVKPPLQPPAPPTARLPIPATAELDDTPYTDTKTVTITSTGHSYYISDHTTASDYSTITSVTLTCSKCGATSGALNPNKVEISGTEDPTCTEDGSIDFVVTVTYNGTEIVSHITETVPATGHSYGTPTFNWATDYSTCTATFTCSVCGDEEEVEADIESSGTEATCTTAGTMTYTATVEFNNQTYTDTQSSVTVPATGHTYGDPTFTWATDYSTCTATFECTEGDDTQTVTAAVDSYATTATCTEDGFITYTATVTFNGTDYTDIQTVTTTAATGHTYGTPTFNWATDYSTCTATFTCTSGDDTQVVDATVTDAVTTDPTCTTDGVRTYTATVTFNGTDYTNTQTEAIAATGHTLKVTKWNWTWNEISQTYDVTATIECSEGDYSTTQTALVESNITNATCTTAGSIVYTATVNLNGTPDSDTFTTTIPATGHTYSGPTWSWDTSDYTATATFTCISGDDTQVVDATVTDAVTTAATCTDVGERTYTATVTFNGTEYTDTCEAEIAATGHDYGEPSWTWTGYTAATATFTCANDSTHVVTVDAEITDETTSATCTEDGETVYTATVTFNGETYTSTQTETIPATGHTYTSVFTWSADYTSATVVLTCSDCGDVVTDNLTVDVTSLGSGVYRASVTYGNVVYTVSVTTYQITWYDEDGYTVLRTDTVAEGDTPDYGETPTKADDDTYHYTFAGWTPTVAAATADASYTATYTSTEHTYGSPTFTWSSDYTSATATFTCSCGHTVTVDATVTTSTSLGQTIHKASVTYGGTSYSSTQTTGTSLLMIQADYTAVNLAIARANGLNASNYTNFDDVTAAINAVQWGLSVLNQSTVNAYADAINEAIDNLVAATVDEEVNIDEPIEGTDTVTEEDSEPEEAEAVASEPETNPTTGITIALLPMAIAALAAASSKRR